MHCTSDPKLGEQEWQEIDLGSSRRTWCCSTSQDYSMAPLPCSAAMVHGGGHMQAFTMHPWSVYTKKSQTAKKERDARRGQRGVLLTLADVGLTGGNGVLVRRGVGRLEPLRVLPCEGE